jgi:peroxiredoxin
MNSTDTPIAAQVASTLPLPDPESAFTKEQNALRETGTPTTLRTGEVFPDAELIAPDGRSISLTEARADRPAVVVLYRGAWCPFCNIALKVYRDELQDSLRARGIELIAVSPQRPDGSMTMKEKHDLDFAVLSDPGNQIARRLGVLTRPSEGARDMQLSHGLDLTQINADGTIGLPMPTVAIVDADGMLAWIDVHPDYTTRTEPNEIIAALDGLGP